MLYEVITPLHWAVSQGETPISYGDDAAPGEWAAIPGVPDEEKRLALIRKLLDHGADLDARVSRPECPIFSSTAGSNTRTP